MKKLKGQIVGIELGEQAFIIVETDLLQDGVDFSLFINQEVTLIPENPDDKLEKEEKSKESLPF